MKNAEAGIQDIDSGSTRTDERDTRVSSGGRSSRSKVAPHSTAAERSARGNAARGELPRSAHAAWEAAALRRDPIDLLEQQTATRLPELAPIRYGRMLVSPFAFFRGGASLMAADLADGPRTGLHAQLWRRRAPVELRHLRRGGSEARLQHQRLRRDAAWAVRVGRQAACRESRRRGAGQGLRRYGTARGRHGGGS